jgi:hypothetical protein
VDLHDDRAYVLAGFTETLRPRDGGPGIEVDGRLVYFWRMEPNGRWTVTRVLTGRVSPDRVAS